MDSSSPLYLRIAQTLAELIAGGSLRPGDALPSVRQASTQHGVSKGTIVQAYGNLEARGLIEARPQSGYYVRAPAMSGPLPRTDLARPVVVGSHRIDPVHNFLGDLTGAKTSWLASSFPDPSLYPLQALGSALAVSNRGRRTPQPIEDLQLGLPELRRAIARRYLELGYAVPMEEIVVTCGGMEAISLSLQAVTKPGDLVVIDSAMFFSGLRLIEYLGLRTIEMPAGAEEGLDLGLLDKTLRRHRVAACLLMTNCQNPLGFSMWEPKKRALVELLDHHGVPLVENDVYTELHFDLRHNRAAKAFDRQGSVLHCGSFTKCLAPGYKVGWVAAGSHRDAVALRKFASTFGTSVPPQVAIAHYLTYQPYARHLRSLRSKLQHQVNEMAAAVRRYFPPETRFSNPQGGYVLWVELPERVDAMALFEDAAARDIGVAPGPIFSASRGYRNFIRLNCSHPWTPALVRTIKWLGERATASA